MLTGKLASLKDKIRLQVEAEKKSAPKVIKKVVPKEKLGKIKKLRKK